jgi:hypothetical protein
MPSKGVEMTEESLAFCPTAHVTSPFTDRARRADQHIAQRSNADHSSGPAHEIISQADDDLNLGADSTHYTQIIHLPQILSTLFRWLERKYRRNMRCSNDLVTLSKFYFRDFFGLVQWLAGLSIGPTIKNCSRSRVNGNDSRFARCLRAGAIAQVG